MCATLKKGYNVPLLLKRIELARSLGPHGKAQFSGNFMEYVTILTSAVEFSSSIPETQKGYIICSTLSAMPVKLPIASERFINEVDQQEKLYLQQPICEYTLITNLSVEYFDAMRPIRLGDCVIYFADRLPTKFSSAREVIRQIGDFPEPPPNSAWVKVRVSARSPEEGGELALRKLGIVRAIWNLHLGHGWLQTSTGRSSPLSEIFAGPIHTIHSLNGQLAVESFWLEPSYAKSITVRSIAGRWRELAKFYKGVVNRLDKISYREKIEEALWRYAKALDMSDWDAAMVKLWGVLELLTGTVRMSHEQTIKRASFIYRDSDYSMQVLRHLKDYRNRAVHVDYSRRDREMIVCQTKNHVGDLVLFHLETGELFESIEEVGWFLDLESDRKQLGRNLAQIKKAIEIHHLR